METLETIRKRCSLKSHLSRRQIEPEKLTAVLEAARMAASSRNKQPWRFIVIQDRELINDLSDAFFDTNKVIAQAPVMIIVAGDPGSDYQPEKGEGYLFDVGMAAGNLLVAATALGLVTHPMAGFDKLEVKRQLHIPEHIRIVMATPLAYPIESNYDEAARDRLSQRTRKNLNEIVHFDCWAELESV
jgi:nitroreductase